jgi:hypothetical protein
LKEISEEVLGFNGRQIRNEWYNGECAEATKVKSDYYQQMLQKHKKHQLTYIKHEEGKRNILSGRKIRSMRNKGVKKLENFIQQKK